VRNKKLLGGAAALLSASLLFSACGSRTEPAATGAANVKIAKIGVIAPLSGDLSALGLGIQNSVDLAIKQANASNAIPGWKLELAAEDDQATKDVGINAATKLAADKDVVGVVGTLNSGVADGVQPVLRDAKITQVSPANTATRLTMGLDPANKVRQAPNYFRVCTNDAVQGAFAAQYAFDAGFKKVAVVNDKKPYGAGLVFEFIKKFKALGGDVVSEETAVAKEDFASVVSNIKPDGPQMVYYGTEYPLAGPFSLAMKTAGLKVPLMGGDGIFDPQFIKLAGTTSDGDIATSVGAPVDKLPSAKAFVDAYNAGGYKDPYAAYGGYSYDAANAIINALKISLPSATDAMSARQATVDAMSKVSFDGATGKVSFDEFGDSTNRTITVYAVEGGKWADKKTGTLS